MYREHTDFTYLGGPGTAFRDQGLENLRVGSQANVIFRTSRVAPRA